jgi:Ca2+-binding RTX toxin-like protein
VTDKGDPWCAITDDNQDVLIHVAKIDGQFVIHDAAADTLRLGDTLSSACDRLLGPAWRNPREDVVVSLSQRQVQSVLAIAVLANFVHEVAESRAETPDAAAGHTTESAMVSALFIAAAAAATPVDAEAHASVSDLLDARPETAYAATEDPGQVAASVGDPEQVLLVDGEAAPAEAPIEAEDEEPDAGARADAQGRAQQGGDGDDLLLGGDGENQLFGGAGDDTAVGGGKNDVVIGGDDNDLLLGLDGHDIIYGNAGNDTGDGGDDWIRGGRGDDSLAGGAGDDFLSGDRGSDTVSGGAGADTFNVFHGGGVDRVTDFSAGEGDRVRIEGGGTIVVRQEGEDTVIRVADDAAVVLVNVQMSTLTTGWLVT